MSCFVKIQSENIKMTWNINFFIFFMICNFSKCDDFTVLYIYIYHIAIIYLKFIACPLQP